MPKQRAWHGSCGVTIWSSNLGDDAFRLKKSFEAATKAGAKYILIVGENEVKADAFALKNLATGEQVSVPRAELVRRIQG